MKKSGISKVSSKSECETLLKSSWALLFKHSNACDLSLKAFQILHEFCEKHAHVTAHLISVRDRDLCDYIEEQTGVRHESPQALIVSDGKVLAHASHRRINHTFLEHSLKTLSDTPLAS